MKSEAWIKGRLEYLKTQRLFFRMEQERFNGTPAGDDINDRLYLVSSQIALLEQILSDAD